MSLDIFAKYNTFDFINLFLNLICIIVLLLAIIFNLKRNYYQVLVKLYFTITVFMFIKILAKAVGLIIGPNQEICYIQTFFTRNANYIVLFNGFLFVIVINLINKNSSKSQQKIHKINNNYIVISCIFAVISLVISSLLFYQSEEYVLFHRMCLYDRKIEYYLNILDSILYIIIFSAILVFLYNLSKNLKENTKKKNKEEEAEEENNSISLIDTYSSVVFNGNQVFYNKSKVIIVLVLFLFLFGVVPNIVQIFYQITNDIGFYTFIFIYDIAEFILSMLLCYSLNVDDLILNKLNFKSSLKIDKDDFL